MLRSLIVAAILLATFEVSSATSASGKWNCNAWHTDRGKFYNDLSPSIVGQMLSPFNAEASAKAGHPVWYNLMGCKKVSTENGPAHTVDQWLRCVKEVKGFEWAKKCTTNNHAENCVMEHPFANDNRYQDSTGKNVFNDIWCRRDYRLPDIECKCGDRVEEAVNQIKKAHAHFVQKVKQVNTPARLEELRKAIAANLRSCKKLRCQTEDTFASEQDLQETSEYDGPTPTQPTPCIDPVNIVSCHPCRNKVEEYCAASPNKSDCFRRHVCAPGTGTCQTGICLGFKSEDNLLQTTDDSASRLNSTQGSPDLKELLAEIAGDDQNTDALTDVQVNAALSLDVNAGAKFGGGCDA